MAALSEQAWFEICAAAGRAPDNDAEARAELSQIIVEYPGLSYDRARTAEAVKRSKRMLKQLSALEADYRAQFPADHRPGDALTIPGFCQRNPMSESTYYKMKNEGRGPRELKIDNRILITEEAEADWRREREQETMAKRALRHEKQQQAARRADQSATQTTE